MSRNVLIILISFLLLGNKIFAENELFKREIDLANTLSYDFIVSNLQATIDSMTHNVNIARSVHYKYGEAEGLFNLSIAYYLKGDYERSTSAAIRAIKIFKDGNMLPELARIYTQYGYQIKQRDLARAKEYMKLGIGIAEMIDLKELLAGSYDNFGVIHEQESNLDSAMYYYQKALSIKHSLNDSTGIPYSLNHIAGIFALKKDYEEALKYLADSDKYREKEKGEFGRALNLVLYGEIYNNMGDIESSTRYFEDCLDKSLYNKNKDLIRYCYSRLTNLYELQRDFEKAFLCQKSFIAYHDSLLNIETNSKIAELEIAYETEKKDRQIMENEVIIRRRTTLLGFTSIFIIVLSVFTFLIYKIQLLKRKQIHQEMELKNNIRQAGLKKKITEEKLRIARELHDNIGSHLTLIVSSLDNMIYNKSGNNTSERLRELSNIGRNTLRELRISIWAMKEEKGQLDKLIIKLNEYKHQIQKTIQSPRIHVLNNIEEPVVLNSLQMLNLFRISQEAVQNAIKHAEATQVQIIFDVAENGFIMQITDDGRGFNLQKCIAGEGIKNMKYRCENTGGVFVIFSSDKGTNISCHISTDDTEK